MRESAKRGGSCVLQTPAGIGTTVAVVLLVLLSACTEAKAPVAAPPQTGAPGTLPGADSHRGSYPPAEPIDPAPPGVSVPVPGDLRVAWSIDLARYDPKNVQVVLSGSTVFVTSGSHTLTALDRDTGAGLWRRSYPATAGRAVQVEPVDADRTLLYHDRSTALVQSRTGAVLWSQETSGGVNDVLYHDASGASGSRPVGVLLCPTNGDRTSFVRAYDVSTGALLWVAPAGATRAMAADAAVVVVGVDRHSLMGLDMKTGAPLWTKALEDAPLTSFATAGNRLIVPRSDRIEAWDPATGEPVWSAPSPPGPSSLVVGAAGDVVAVTQAPPAGAQTAPVGTASAVRGLSVANGEQRWSFDPGQASLGQLQPPPTPLPVLAFVDPAHSLALLDVATGRVTGSSTFTVTIDGVHGAGGWALVRGLPGAPTTVTAPGILFAARSAP